jgi:PTH1 family peptidyl-tRNA hydrolase
MRALGDIKLILGIGNPGKEYEHTYHNAGLLAFEHLAARDGAGAFRRAPHKAFSYAKGRRFIFARSLTFMNESGRAAQDACAFFKVPSASLAVLHDESDLPFGSFKWTAGRGAAGHRGVASIITFLGTNKFARCRIGIRPPAASRRKAGEFVLTHIPSRDQAALTRTFESIATELGLQPETQGE